MSEANQHQHPPYPPYPYYQPEEDELSLIDLWNIVWKRKWPWLVFGPLFAIIGTFYALNTTEIYRAEVLLAPNNDDQQSSGLSSLAGQFGGLASVAGINLGGGNSTETSLATLKSRKFLIPFLTQKDYLQTLFTEEWDEASQSWTVSSDRRDDTKRPTNLEAYKRFTEKYLQVSEDKKTGIVKLAVELPNPSKAADWANELASTLNEYLRQKAKTETEANLAYLNQQLKETTVLEIRESLYSLIENESKSAMLANAKRDFAFEIIDPAVVPEQRSRPKRTLIVIAAGLLGGFFGLFLCFVIHFIEVSKKQNKATNSSQ